MKMTKYLFMLVVLLVAGACNRSDDTDVLVDVPEGPAFDENTASGARMKAFYDDYGVWCQCNVPSKDLYYAWTTSDNWTTSGLDYEYEEADESYIVKALDFLENEVIGQFPKSIIDSYLGLNIALEGRMFNTFALETNYLNYTTIEDYPDLTLSYEEPKYGWNGSRYLMLAPVGPEFDEVDKNTLRRKWTALIITEAMKNLPNPDDFEKANQAAWDAFYYAYDDYIVGDHEDGWYFSDYTGKYVSPYADGLVEPGPVTMVTLYDDYDDVDNKVGFYALVEKFYGASSCSEAFASFVAYIMYATAAEKAEIRSMNDQVLVNEGLVKAYCKKHLNWEIPELGE